jgi:phosphoribosylaminoimidazolecarboxamide formyltransferase/IMP cyclohydrolase
MIKEMRAPMKENYRKAYHTITEDYFPKTITMDFGGQILIFEKQSWKIRDEDTGEVVEKGLRYGENPGQRAALYRLVNGNLTLGDCTFIQPGKGLVSSITEQDMFQFGKHPGKINFTDIDNSLNILRYLMDRPCTVITKHNNPCGVAYGNDLAESYARANSADRIAAFGGCAAFNRTVDKPTAELVAQNYLEVVAAPDFAGEALDLLKKTPQSADRAHQEYRAFGSVPNRTISGLQKPHGRRLHRPGIGLEPHPFQG